MTLSTSGLLSGTMTGDLVPSLDVVITDSKGRTCVQTMSFAGNITPDIFSQVPSYFGSGRNYPAGNYRISYVNGAVLFSTSMPNLWRVSWQSRTTPDPIQYWVMYNDVGSYHANPFPSVDSDYPTQSACESGNSGTHLDIVHLGGQISMFLADYPYSDNGPGSPNPTFSLTKLP